MNLFLILSPYMFMYHIITKLPKSSYTIMTHTKVMQIFTINLQLMISFNLVPHDTLSEVTHEVYISPTTRKFTVLLHCETFKRMNSERRGFKMRSMGGEGGGNYLQYELVKRGDWIGRGSRKRHCLPKGAVQIGQRKGSRWRVGRVRMVVQRWQLTTWVSNLLNAYV